MKTSGFIWGLAVMQAASCWAQLCPHWSEGRIVGKLDERVVFEASGLAASRLVPGRLYHVNDSGNASGFIISNESGRDLRTVLLTPPHVIDPEDLAVGPCDARRASHCLFIGDMGDNGKGREDIRVDVIAERAEYKSPVQPLRRLVLRYPDGPHDAESLGVDPRSGDLYILTKEFILFPRLGTPAQLFRVPAKVWRSAKEGEVIVLETYGAIDLPAMTQARQGRLSHVATSMDISPDGKRLLVQTYDHAWEIAWDLADGPPPPVDELLYQIIRMTPVLGKETIAWLPDGGGFVHGKEYKPDQEPSVLIRFDCLEP